MLRMFRRPGRTGILGLLLFFGMQDSAASGQKAERLREVAAAIALGADSAGRRAAITGYLQAAGAPFQLQDFVDRRMRAGTNIVVTLPGSASKTILLGAHYDRVPAGQGVLDNAASCAVLLELLPTFKTSPLKNYTLKVVFFDLEEGGLSGSQAYFAPDPSRPFPDYAVNLDIFGYGDAIFATASKPGGPLETALQSAGTEFKIPVRMVSPAQYPGSDHRSMMTAGIETVGMSLLDAAEIDVIINLLAGRSAEIPPVLQTIHTAKDNLATIRSEEMQKAIPFLEKMLRLLDAQ
jgi:Zn-dependent M28 family amino/carboxypeptidase